MKKSIGDCLHFFWCLFWVSYFLVICANAQNAPCGPTGSVEKRIHHEYGESLVGAGIVPGGILFTTTNPESGSFTIMLRRKDGQTCILMGGTGYATQEPTKPGVRL